MAAKDVKNYFISVQDQYTQLVSLMEYVKKDYQKGLITEEQLKQMLSNTQVDVIRANYETMAYITFLLAKPGNKKSREEYENIFKDLGVTKEQCLDKNEEILKNFKKFYYDYKKQLEEQ